ncbi:MAG: hypothetical protein U0Q16_00640 [Bryobacteraceae bacterium]
MKQPRPFVFQRDAAGKLEEVAGGYKVEGGRVAFELAPYDHSRELVIDPVIVNGTYFGATIST